MLSRPQQTDWSEPPWRQQPEITGPHNTQAAVPLSSLKQQSQAEVRANAIMDSSLWCTFPYLSKIRCTMGMTQAEENLGRLLNIIDHHRLSQMDRLPLEQTQNLPGADPDPVPTWSRPSTYLEQTQHLHGGDPAPSLQQTQTLPGTDSEPPKRMCKTEPSQIDS